MKPRVFSMVWTDCRTKEQTRRWHVEFEDAGCPEEEYFNTHLSAARFAYHVAMGGSRWEFIA